MIDFLLDVFREHAGLPALVYRDDVYTYSWLLDAVSRWTEFLETERVSHASVVSLESDYSPEAIAAFLALVEHRCVVVPLTPTVEARKIEFRRIAQVERRLHLGKPKSRIYSTARVATHELYEILDRHNTSGLVLFSSGSTGRSKAAVHDFGPLLDKFRVKRHSLRTISFLLFDHIGGINTLLYTLSNAGCLVLVEDRRPDTVCSLIEEHKVQLLPTSPTFINLLLASEAYRNHDLSSLELVTYGTEVMPEGALRRLHELLPDVRLQQTYGLSELGILRSKSRSSDSLWVRIGGEGFETRVVDGKLEVKARSAMLGYLNAPRPFTEDGWFRTGDVVEVDGEYLRFLGRESEVINVGGEKVYPAEVESIIEEIPGVEECTVTAQKNPIVGEIVTATVSLRTEESPEAFQTRMWKFCRNRVEKFKIPQRVVISATALHGSRFKKMRRSGAALSNAPK